MTKPIIAFVSFSCTPKKENIRTLTYIIKARAFKLYSFCLEQCLKLLEVSFVFQTLFLQVTGQRLVTSVRKRCILYAVLSVLASMGCICFHLYEPFVPIWAVPTYMFGTAVQNTVISYWSVTFRSLTTAGRSLFTCLKVIYIYIYKVVQIWPGQTVTCLHTNSPGHIWTTLYINVGLSEIKMSRVHMWFPHKFS
jgi:hypothetical protein